MARRADPSQDVSRPTELRMELDPQSVAVGLVSMFGLRCAFRHGTPGKALAFRCIAQPKGATCEAVESKCVVYVGQRLCKNLVVSSFMVTVDLNANSCPREVHGYPDVELLAFLSPTLTIHISCWLLQIQRLL